MRPVSLSRRVLAIAAAVFFLGATLAPDLADARAGKGGGFGSRGSRTYSSPPPTATAPGAAPMERSITQPNSNFGNQGAAMNRPGAPAAQQGGMFGRFGGGLMGGLMGGLLGAGLFGLLSGSGLFGGLGSMASILGLILQVGIIFIVVRLIMNWMRRRQQPETATAAAGPGGYRFDAPSSGGDRPQQSSYGYQGGGSAMPASGGGDAIELDGGDFDLFEQMLKDVQEAWSRQDLSRLRGLATPEMVEMFGDDLAEDASRGVVNKVSGIKLLQGDLAESWREGQRDYATVAMRYELVDVTEDRESGRVVDGDPVRVEEATELWTFMRVSGGKWMLSAIQQAR